MVAGTLLVFFLAGGGLESCSGLPLSDGSDLPFDQAACESGDATAIAQWQSYADDRFVHAQTMTLSVFIMFQLFNVMNCRSQEEYIFIGCIFKQSNKHRFCGFFLLIIILCSVG